MIPPALLEPVLRRPIPWVAAAVGAGLLAGLVLRARGDFVRDESHPGLLGRATRTAGRSWIPGATSDDGEPLIDASLSREIVDRLRTTMVDVAAGYLDRAVDRVADATERAVRP